MLTCLEPLLEVQEMQQGKVLIHGVSPMLDQRRPMTAISASAQPVSSQPAGGFYLRFCKTVGSSREPRLQSRLL